MKLRVRRFGNRNELYVWKGTPLANTPANGSQQAAQLSPGLLRLHSVLRVCYQS